MYHYYYTTRVSWTELLLGITFGSKERGVKRHRTILFWCLSTLENFSTGRSPHFFDRSFHLCIISSLQYFVIFFACMNGYLPKFRTPLCHMPYGLREHACFTNSLAAGLDYHAIIKRKVMELCVCVCVCVFSRSLARSLCRVFCLVHFV
jgi:hypothetical protein